MMKYDVAVIGGGPAGLSASIFASRAGLNTICFEKLVVGGQAALSYDIANYPAFDSISGIELSQKMFSHAEASGTEFVFGDVQRISKSKNGFEIKTNKNTYEATKLIIACGTKARSLNIGEDKFVGRGVSYCASCDGNFFKNKKVCVVGGGDSAFEYVEYLSRIAKEVILLNRSDKFKANSFRVNNAKKIANVNIKTNSVVESIVGDKTLEHIVINEKGRKKKITTDGLFIAVGHIPNLNFIDFKINLDSNGYILVDEHMRTSEKNVFACGDIVSKHFKQVITACADGAIAGNSCIGGTNDD